MWCGIVWYGMVQYDMTLYGTVRYDVVWCDTPIVINYNSILAHFSPTILFLLQFVLLFVLLLRGYAFYRHLLLCCSRRSTFLAPSGVSEYTRYCLVYFWCVFRRTVSLYPRVSRLVSGKNCVGSKQPVFSKPTTRSV